MNYLPIFIFYDQYFITIWSPISLLLKKKKMKRNNNLNLDK